VFALIPAFSAKSRTPQPNAALAILHCVSVNIWLLNKLLTRCPASPTRVTLYPNNNSLTNKRKNPHDFGDGEALPKGARAMANFLVWLIGLHLILVAAYFATACLLAIVEVAFYSEPKEMTKQELKTAREALLQAQGLIAEIRSSFLIAEYAQGAHMLNDILKLLTDQLDDLDRMISNHA
jgi:hypothetical protein